MERIQFWRLDNDGVRALMSVSSHLARSGLESTLLDLVYLRVSQLTDCSYCVDAHVKDAITHGLDERVVKEVARWRESPVFNARQRAGLAWAEAVTDVAKSGVPDDAYREAAGAFSETELVDLTLAIALMNAFARIAIAFRHGPPPMPALIGGAAATASVSEAL